jgi:cytochrome c-type biogenesis protein CcmH/NrfG
MARILAEQGHFKRSLAIYARLLDEEPEDAELGAEVEAVRTEARARRSHAPH